MAAELDLLSPTDKPALLGVSSAELLTACQKALGELDYKVHKAESHADFLSRFAQAQYQVVILEELFHAHTRSENQALSSLQSLPMGQRRHAVSLLFGRAYQTLHPMQAYQESVHAVINPGDVDKLAQIVQKVVADNNLFYSVYREAQLRMAQGS